MKELCGLYGKSRQAWYERSWRKWDYKVKEEVVLDLINEITQGYQMGIHNLYPVLKPRLVELGIKMGRAKVQDVRRKYGLSVVRKAKKVKTTNSRHHYHKWPYLAEGFLPDRAEQLWVSDITYIRIRKHFAFLSLITDAYSRKIVGYHLSRDLSTKSCLKALEMALSEREHGDRKLIHHSDRGVQYCSYAYTAALRESEVRISMGRKGQVLDNAIAERMNGILKDCYRMKNGFASFKRAEIALRGAIYHYNYVRPHSSIEWLRPAEAHRRTGYLERKWKSSYLAIEKEENKPP
jgi:putative transposase